MGGDGFEGEVLGPSFEKIGSRGGGQGERGKKALHPELHTVANEGVSYIEVHQVGGSVHDSLSFGHAWYS